MLNTIATGLGVSPPRSSSAPSRVMPPSTSPPQSLTEQRSECTTRQITLAGPDDAAFCHRTSEALALGYQLYGSPAALLSTLNE